MQHPIPSPRRSDDVRPMPRPIPLLPRRTPLIGPACPVCEHPSCRVRRAQRLPRLGGHRSEFARPSPSTTLNGRLRRSFSAAHAQAAAIQARHRHLIVYYGEATQSFWAVTPTGLLEAANADALLLALWPHNAPFMPPALAVEALTPVPA
ncbi:hypothetical protein [Nocardiopsis alborubida]|uniref:Uncharacterized protein n=2 Tax=Nocardiopsis alborubida TaxID=146802 RepID=A0A7X6MBM7_9ACTN|nr:hypothetical protein [Nocardiopsis alborubida]NKY97003.1 hypothetical protein [Nocardiopsis alborubida]